MAEAGTHGEKQADPYPLLRMVEDMNQFRLAGDLPAQPKYHATITVVLARAATMLPTSWNDFDLTTGTIKPGSGVPRVVGFNNHMTANHHKVIHDSLRTWLAYLENAVAQGEIEFNLRVVEADDPVECDFMLREAGEVGKIRIDCHYPFDEVMDNLPQDVVASTQWYFMAYPYLPKELTNYTDFQGMHDFEVMEVLCKWMQMQWQYNDAGY